jgi:hypothetical protein
MSELGSITKFDYNYDFHYRSHITLDYNSDYDYLIIFFSDYNLDFNYTPMIFFDNDYNYDYLPPDSSITITILITSFRLQLRVRLQKY